MNLIQFCIERKVTVAMCTATIFLFGLISWFRLDREFMPQIQFPELVVLTHYPNASSREVENLVTRVVEEAAGTVKNVQRIRSSSREGISVVTVELNWGTNVDMASLNLREKVDLAKSKLPREAGEPRIERYNPFEMPVMTLSLSGPVPDKDLFAIAQRPVKEMLERAKGVAAVSMTGGREREIQIDLDQSELTARGLPILDVGEAIARANVTVPAGTVTDKTFEYVVRVLGTFRTPEDLGNISVAVDRSKVSSSLSPEHARQARRAAPSGKRTPQPISLSSIGTVTDTLAEPKSYSRYDGRPNISLSIYKHAEAAIVRTAEEIEKKLPDIRSKLPEGVTIHVVYDQSTLVKNGISSMVLDSAIGAVLAFAVLFLFLGHWRDALVVSVAIPISIMATLFLMQMRGMSLNTVSLAGLAIGIGILVDGTIVVQENIVRHQHMGKPKMQAALDGAKEMVSAVTSSILTTVAVFLPLTFVTGIAGQVFKDLSWSVVLSQMVSLAVAFTVLPMLSARIGSQEEFEHSPWILDVRKQAGRWMKKYEKILDHTLEHPARIITIAAALCALSLAILFWIPRSLFPKVESGQILLQLELPVGSPLESTDRAARAVEDAIKEFPDVLHRSVSVGSIPQEGLQPLGPHQAQIILDLSPSRRRSNAELIALMRPALSNAVPKGGRVFFFDQNGSFSFLKRNEAAIAVQVKGHDLAKLEQISKGIASEISNVKGLTNVRTDLGEPSPELKIDVKRDALADLSISVTDLAQTVLTAVQGSIVSKFHDDGKEVNIRLRLRKADREDPSSVEKLTVHSPLDVDVPLGAVASVEKSEGPSEILRIDQQRVVTVSADVSGRSTSRAAGEVEKILPRFQADKSVSVALKGESEQARHSLISLVLVLALSIFLNFAIMAAEFEDLCQPFLILFTIPLALIGMAAGLLLSGHELSAISAMGLVLLTGIVVDNGSILFEFVNELRREGAGLKDALKQACLVRLRPILMTALANIFGMLPLALNIGNGAGMQSPMAVVIVSGLLVSTVLTLVVLPALLIFAEEKFPWCRTHR